MDVSKVAGNFHFAAGKSLHHSQNFLSSLLDIPLGEYNVSDIWSVFHFLAFPLFLILGGSLYLPLLLAMY